jgi:Zn-dependent M28 family amino/carboxypeptidase
MRKSYILLPIILALLSLVLVAACLAPGSQTSAIPSPIASPTPRPPFSGESAYQYVQAQMAFGPRPTGTEAHRKTGDYIIAQLKQLGWQVEEQPFEYQGVQARNIIAKQGSGRGKPIIILGAHYDTRRQADNDPDPKNHTKPVPGANDGASGVAVLLEMARALNVDKTGREIWLAFFDAEDNGRLDGWEWIVGATHLAQQLTVTPTAMVLLDMIGDADQQLYWDRNSNPQLNEQIWKTAESLGFAQVFIPQYKWTMIDDHIPFAQRGIPAIDLIDFDYPPWHTTFDTADKVSPLSLERIGQTIKTWLEQTPP